MKFMIEKAVSAVLGIFQILVGLKLIMGTPDEIIGGSVIFILGVFLTLPFISDLLSRLIAWIRKSPVLKKV